MLLTHVLHETTTGWPAGNGTLSSLKTRNDPPFGPSFLVGMGPLGMREPDFEPFSWFGPSFPGAKNVKV